MSREVPHSIKVQVIKDWLKGISRNAIADKNEIGYGTVSKIIQQTRIKDIVDIDLLRGVSVILKKNNLDLNYLASSIRLYSILNKLQLTEDQIETLLEQTSVHCFKNGNGNIEEFFLLMNQMVYLANSVNISIYDLPEYIDKAKLELDRLDDELIEKHNKINLLFSEYNTTLKDLQEFKKSRPLASQITILKEELIDKKNTISILKQKLDECELELFEQQDLWSMSEFDFDDTNKKISKRGGRFLDLKELFELAHEFYSNPSKYVDVIELMRKRSKIPQDSK